MQNAITRILVALVAPLGVAMAANAGHHESEKKSDIVDVAVSAGQFNTLAAALEAADLVSTLKSDGPFTVFAPTDEAFAKLPEGTITEEGLRSNVNIGIRYMAAWLSGNGCVPIFNLMEDAATAEISRAQIWQWIRHPGGVLDDGRRVTAELYKQVRDEELGKIQADVGDAEFAGGNYRAAAELLDKITLDDEFIEFLTLVAYEEID